MVIDVRQTLQFADWLESLRDRQGAKVITNRIARLRRGAFGDVKYFDRIGELRIDHGPGYRLYFAQQGQTIVILLYGGDKSTQRRDIEKAKQLASEL